MLLSATILAFNAFCLAPVLAQELNLSDLTQKAIACSPELKMARISVAISKTDIKTARADYFPQIRANANIEYLKDLEKGYRPVTTIGNSIIPAGTRYQNSVGVTLSQSLIDFGARRQKVQIAKKDVQAKSLQYEQAVRDLKLKLVDAYVDALVSYRSWKANEAILNLAQNVYQMKKRLYQAGTLSNVNVTEEAIQVAQALDDIEAHKHQLEKQLEDLSYFTQESYAVETTDLADLHIASDSIAFNEELAPEVRIADLEIEKKQKEVAMLRRQALPQISYYTNYNIYGFDPDNWNKSFANLSQRTISFGLSVNMPVFDGLKTQASIEKALLEVEKLKADKEAKVLQLRHQADVYHKQLDGFTVQLQTKATIVNKTQDKLSMVARLSEQQIVDRTQASKEQIQRIQKQLEAEKVLIQGAAAQIKLAILATG